VFGHVQEATVRTVLRARLSALLLLLTLTLGVLLGGCASQKPGPAGASPSPSVPASPPTPTPTPPVVWRIGLAQDITTTNVWAVLGPQATAWNFYVLINRYPKLYRFSDAQLDWVPLAADGFPTPVTQEGDLWTATVRLKPGMTWSDGQPVTAEDVVFTVNTVLEFELFGNWGRLVDPNVIDRAEAVDALTVKVYFKAKPGLARWQYGTAMMPFVAAHFWGPLVEQARLPDSLEGRQQALFAIQPESEPTAGEMLLTKWEKGGFIELSANDRYFFRDSVVTQYENGAYLEEKPGAYREEASGAPGGETDFSFIRGPHLTSVIYSIYPSQDAAVLALKKGEIDYFISPTGLQRGFQQQLAASQDVRVIANESNNVNFLGFNLRRQPMDNTAFRRAVEVLIDKEFIASTVLQGAVEPAYSFVPSGNAFWHNADVQKRGRGLSREERVAEAVRLLEEAGFTYDVAPSWDAQNDRVIPGEGLRMPNGELAPDLEILSPTTGFDPFLATFAVWTERWLQEAGIPVRVTFAGFNSVVIPRIMQQDVDMWLIGLGLTVFPDYMRDFLHSSQSAPGNMNIAGYASPGYDALADELVQSTDLDEARTIAYELQEMIAEDAPYLFFYTSQILEPVRTDVDLPYVKTLSGLQHYFQSMNGPLSFVRLE
jgi:ABC-type transport system substrate-binding protein